MDYVAYKETAKKNQHSGDNADASDRKEMAEARLKEAKASQEEIKLNLLEREIHMAEDVKRIWSDVIANFRSKAMALPPKGASLIHGEEDIEEVEKTLTRLVVEMLTDLIDYDPKELNPDPIPRDSELADAASDYESE